jgi:3-hydroxyisobutyrate dehydrogenase
VLNNWLADLAGTTAETLSFARQLGLDPALIVDLLESTPLGSPYAVQKARSMLAGDFSPAFALKFALKDADLAAQAAEAIGTELTLTSALPRWRRAVAAGHADDDVAAIYATPLTRPSTERSPNTERTLPDPGTSAFNADATPR